MSPDLAFLRRPPASAGEVSGTKNVPPEGGHLRIFESFVLSSYHDLFVALFFFFAVFGWRKVFMNCNGVGLLQAWRLIAFGVYGFINSTRLPVCVYQFFATLEVSNDV